MPAVTVAIFSEEKHLAVLTESSRSVRKAGRSVQRFEPAITFEALLVRRRSTQVSCW